jgi:hypothetical protein
MSEEIAGIFKAVLTGWQEGIQRRITGKDGNEKIQFIPPHVSLVITNIHGPAKVFDYGQTESRYLTIEIKIDSEKSRMIRKFIDKTKEDISEAYLISHLIWSYLKLLPREVTFHREFWDVKSIPPRDYKRFKSLLQCNALLHNREITNEDDVRDVEIFLTYSKPMIDHETPAHERDALAVLGVLSEKEKNIPTIIAGNKTIGREGAPGVPWWRHD